MNYSITPISVRSYNQSFGTLTYAKDNHGFRENAIPQRIENGMPDKLDTSKSAKKLWKELNEAITALKDHEIECELDVDEGVSNGLKATFDGDHSREIKMKNKWFKNSMVEFFKDLVKEADKRKEAKNSVQSQTMEMLTRIAKGDPLPGENTKIINLDQDTLTADSNAVTVPIITEMQGVTKTIPSGTEIAGRVDGFRTNILITKQPNKKTGQNDWELTGLCANKQIILTIQSEKSDCNKGQINGTIDNNEFDIKYTYNAEDKTITFSGDYDKLTQAESDLLTMLIHDKITSEKSN